MKKLAIPAILAATVMVAGLFAFAPVEQASTVHTTIIGEDGITNQDIAEELQDKIKMMAATDTETVIIGPSYSGYNILVEALDENEENVIFNLKEVYVCGDASTNATIEVAKVFIDNLSFNQFGYVTSADITIADEFGDDLGIVLIDGNTCVDVISALANNGRAGAMGLGTDDELVIHLSGDWTDSVDYVKCVAFTPNSAEELVCDIQPIQNGVE